MTHDDGPGNLTDRTQALTGALGIINAANLADVTGLVFARFLDYKTHISGPAQAKLEYNAQKVAAFILINQIFFYHTLSCEDPKFPPLTASQNIINDLQNLFNKTVKTGFASIFAPNIATILPNEEQIIAALNEVVLFALDGAMRSDLIWTQQFAKLIPLEIRKHIAAFYTSPVGAQLLANLSIHSCQDAVLDLACGTGTLLVCAYERKRSLLNQGDAPSSEQDLKLHHRFLEALHGNDAVPFTAQLTAMNLALRGPLVPPPPIHVTAGDGFQVQVQTPSSASDVPVVDVVLMNPPFTRHERIAPEFSQAIQDRLTKEGYGNYIAGKMSLQHFFLFHADSFLAPGGRLAFVLPANTFNIDLSEKLIRFLMDKRYHVDYLVAVNSRTGAFSEDCNYKEYLFVATKGTLTDAAQTNLVLLSALPPLANVGEVTDFLNTIHGPASLKRGSVKVDVRCVNTRQLYSADKWDPAFWNLNDPELLSILSHSPNIVPLNRSEEFTFVTGFHSTHCDWLILPNRLFKVVGDIGTTGLEIERRSDGTRVIIPKEYLRPCLREAKLYQGIYATSRHWVLSVHQSESLPTEVHQIFLDYTTKVLQDDVRGKAKRGGKVRERLDSFWYTHPRVTGCETKVGQCWTFNRYGIWRRNNAAFYTDTAVTGNDGFHMYDYTGAETTKEEALQLLASWFNTSLHLFDFLRKCRVPATHVQQCLKPDRELMYVPQIKSFTPEERELLLANTRKFHEAIQGTILEQVGGEPRREFDEVWLKALHIPPEQFPAILSKLYPVLRYVIAAR